jgi:hypothetical protein
MEAVAYRHSKAMNRTKEPSLCHVFIIQLRQAGYLVGTGEMSIDEAVAAYGSFTK